MLYLALVCLALVALLAYREWGAARERTRTAQERRELYQRIQAPDVAVLEHVRAERPKRRPPRPIAADDDAAFLARSKEVTDG